MAYLSKENLTTHLYLEKITEITRDYKLTYANLAAFPATGITGNWYFATDTAKYYKWNGVAYVETAYIDYVSLAIKHGVSEAISYLNRYDVKKMFSDTDAERTFQDDFLDSKVKDLICWQLIKLANPNIDMTLFRTNYEDAVKYFKDVMKGNVDPAWPLRTDDPDTTFDESGHISSSSNIKRSNHY